MAGAEKLIEKILDEAHLQAHKNIEQAKVEAANIIQTAKDEVEAVKNEIIQKAYLEAEERKRRLVAVAKLEARKQKLRAKREIVEEAFNKALERLDNLPADQYEAILVGMIVQLVSTGSEEIILSDKDKKRLGPDFIKRINKQLNVKGIKSKVQLADEIRPMRGGFILKTGDIELNNSFDTIIRMQRSELEGEVVRTLF